MCENFPLKRCHDCGNDPWGCLGCQACGVQDCRYEHSYVFLNYKGKTSQKKTYFLLGIVQPPLPNAQFGQLFYFCFCPKNKSTKSIWAGRSPPRHTIIHFSPEVSKSIWARGFQVGTTNPQFGQRPRKKGVFSGTSSLRVNIISGSVDSTTLLTSPAEPFPIQELMQI